MWVCLPLPSVCASIPPLFLGLLLPRLPPFTDSSPFLSQRPPINWNSAPPKASAYLFPYVLTWSEVKATINVFSLLVQNMVQEISFQVGVATYIRGGGGGLYTCDTAPIQECICSVSTFATEVFILCTNYNICIVYNTF